MDHGPAQNKGKRRRVESNKSSDNESQGSKDSVPGTKSQTKGEPKNCTRPAAPGMLWDATKKEIFFDAVNEFGKDFDKIHNYFNTKIKKVYGNVDTYHVIKIEQVRDFYQNTLKKTSQIVDTKKLHHLILGEGGVGESMIREYREVLVLLAYWQVMKHAKRMKWPTEKLHGKINELIFQGSTCLRIKSRNLYVQRTTPKFVSCMKSGRTPPEFTLDILPYNNWSWGIVQNIAQNPRIRLKVSAKKSVADITKMLINKWDKAKSSSTLESLQLRLRAPSTNHYRIPGGAGISTRTIPPDVPPARKQASSTSGPHKQPEQEDQILSYVGEQIDIQTEYPEMNPAGMSDNSFVGADTNADVSDAASLHDVVTDPSAIDQNTSITESELSDIIDRVEPEDHDDDSAPEKAFGDAKDDTVSKRRTLSSTRSKETDEALERDRLVALDYWDADTSSLLTIGHVYTKFADMSKELHIEYEWRVDEQDLNSTHNILALRRLCNLGHTEFERISRQGKYRDLFISLNMSDWTTILPNCKTVEVQTQTDESLLSSMKTQMTSVSVQAGKDRLMLPQPSKIGGFIIPAPAIPPKTMPSSSFSLPKRPFPKKKPMGQRTILPKREFTLQPPRFTLPHSTDNGAVPPALFYTTPPPHHHVHTPDDGVMLSERGVTSTVTRPGVITKSGGLELSSLMPDQMVPPKIHSMFTSPDKDRELIGEGFSSGLLETSHGYEGWDSGKHEGGMSTLNSLVADHSNHDSNMGVAGDARATTRDDAAQEGTSILDELVYST